MRRELARRSGPSARLLEPLGHAQSIVTVDIVGAMVASGFPAQSTACYVWRLMRREGVARIHGGCLDASSSHLGPHRARDRALASPVPARSETATEAIAQDPRRGDRAVGSRSAQDRPRCRGSFAPGATCGRERRRVPGIDRAAARSARADRRGAGLRRRARSARSSRPETPRARSGSTYHLAAVNVQMAFYDRAGVELDPPTARSRPRRRNCRAASTTSIRRWSTTRTGSTSSWCSPPRAAPRSSSPSS